MFHLKPDDLSLLVNCRVKLTGTRQRSQNRLVLLEPKQISQACRVSCAVRFLRRHPPASSSPFSNTLASRLPPPTPAVSLPPGLLTVVPRRTK
jgi:hypothetical protein